MKVLFVCTVPTEKSGIPGVVFNLMNGFRGSGIELGYVAINEPDESYRRILKGLDAGLYVIPRKISNPLRYVKDLAKVARGYDVVHVHGNSATMVLEMLAAKLAGVRLRIAHSHNTSCSMKGIDKCMRYLFYTLCNGRMACGEEAGRWLFRDKGFKVLNNGIDSEKYRFSQVNRDRLRRSLDWEDNAVIGHVGNFVEQKNHRFLIEIFRSLYARNDNVRLLLLGAGPLQPEIEEMVKGYGIEDKVHFAGSVNNPHEYMSAMDFVVMPSLFEGLPLTLVEEQANGLECLVADTITRDADLTGNVHYMSLNESADKWARRIEAGLADKNRDEVSARGIEDIKRSGFDISSAVKDLADYYASELQKYEKK